MTCVFLFLYWPFLTAGPFYLNVVPWLKKVPAETLTLIILKLSYFFTFKNINIFKRPLLIIRISLDLMHNLFPNIIINLAKRGPF